MFGRRRKIRRYGRFVNPDKEGGEIIDMLDHGGIPDIKFTNNFVYNNVPSGKMHLGIAIIIAK